MPTRCTAEPATTPTEVVTDFTDTDHIYVTRAFAGLTPFVVTHAGADTTPNPAASNEELVMASISYVLGDTIEDLTLTGAADIDAVGNGVNNLLTGNSGDNHLTGGAGADTFTFLGGSGADTVTDFSAAQDDRIDVHAYNAQSTAVITQVGSDTKIDLGGGNTVTVMNTTATNAAFLSHIVW